MGYQAIRKSSAGSTPRSRSWLGSGTKSCFVLGAAFLAWINLTNYKTPAFTSSNDATLMLPHNMGSSRNLLRQTATDGIIAVVDHRPMQTSAPQITHNTPKANKKLRPLKSAKEWRHSYYQKCQEKSSSEKDVMETLQQFFEPLPESSRKPTSAKLEPCQYTFIDWGANIGDSLGKFIDSGMDNCEQKGYTFTPKYDLEEGKFLGFHEKENVLVRFARHVMRKAGRHPKRRPPRYPEQYCYVGVEGNPVFTERLQKLQQQVMNTLPRPVKSAHFLTETVGAGTDGPTVLYLDTISKDKNFWGSSVLNQPKYVRESAIQHNNGVPIEAKVQGITMTTLVKQTIIPKKKSHLIMKIDIEGGEHQLLREAYQSGILCDYVEKGVVIQIILEKHGPQFAAANLDMALWDKFMRELNECGVEIQGGYSAGR